MNIKEELIKLKEKIKGVFTSESVKQLEKMSEKDRMKYWASNFKYFNEQSVSPYAKALSDHLKNSEMAILDDKVDEFIDWFTENMVKGNYTDIGEYSIPSL